MPEPVMAKHGAKESPPLVTCGSLVEAAGARKGTGAGICECVCAHRIHAPVISVTGRWVAPGREVQGWAHDDRPAVKHQGAPAGCGR